MLSLLRTPTRRNWSVFSRRLNSCSEEPRATSGYPCRSIGKRPAPKATTEEHVASDGRAHPSQPCAESNSLGQATVLHRKQQRLVRGQQWRGISRALLETKSDRDFRSFLFFFCWYYFFSNINLEKRQMLLFFLIREAGGKKGQAATAHTDNWGEENKIQNKNRKCCDIKVGRTKNQWQFERGDSF